MFNGQSAVWNVNSIKNTLKDAVKPEKIMTLSDQLANSRARLDAVTMTFDDGGSIAEIEKRVMASAQRSRIAYFDAVDSVTNLALNAHGIFGSFEEAIGFQELINKEFGLGSASIQQQKTVMEQLTEAMSGGGLTAKNIADIWETAPDMVQNIADYMNVPVERVQGLAAEGRVTAQVVKNAMFAASDEIESKFNNMSMTWGQVWTNMKNIMIATFNPILEGINAIANSPIIEYLAESIAREGRAIVNAWGLIEPIIIGVAGAWLIYTAATKAAAIAQWALNSAFLSNPLTWVLVVIIAIIAALTKWVQKMGGLRIAWATVMTGIVDFAGFAKTQFLLTLESMVNKGIDIINALINTLNKTGLVSFDTISHVIFGTNVAIKENFKRMERGFELEILKLEVAKGKENQKEKGFNYDDFGLDLDSLYSPSVQTAENTAVMADAMSISEEDLAYMRDIAEREAINRFTTAEVKIDMTGMTNRIDSNMDLDGVLTTLTDGFAEALEVAAEGVHM